MLLLFFIIFIMMMMMMMLAKKRPCVVKESLSYENIDCTIFRYML